MIIKTYFGSKPLTQIKKRRFEKNPGKNLENPKKSGKIRKPGQV